MDPATWQIIIFPEHAGPGDYHLLHRSGMLVRGPTAVDEVHAS